MRSEPEAVTIAPSNQSARLVCHVIDGSLDFVIGQRSIGTARRHHALGTGETFKRVLVKHVVALGDAWAPVGFVARLGRTRGANSVAHGADLAKHRLADRVFRDGGCGRRWRSNGCRCSGRCSTFFLSAGGQQRQAQGGQQEGGFVHGLSLSIGMGIIVKEYFELSPSLKTSPDKLKMYYMHIIFFLLC